MGLDIRFSKRVKIFCPKCGENIGTRDVCSVSSGGKVWYPILEELGYYVPYEQRTEDNDWYGKDMELLPEQARFVYKEVSKKYFYDGQSVAGLIAAALIEDATVVVNADW